MSGFVKQNAMKRKKEKVHIIIASGGTGGHLFPAQALALEILQKAPYTHITFVGAGLKKSAYFKKDLFAFFEIKSETPIKKRPLKRIKAWLLILQGFLRCVKFFKKTAPNLIVGFGSYHTFPALCAARAKKIPIVLFEPNVFPGKVNRFCSRWAKLSAIQFLQAAKYLQGKPCPVQMPRFNRQKTITQKQARSYFHLDPEKVTLLVFGGSQGSASINSLFCNALTSIIAYGNPFQVIHIVGRDKSIGYFQDLYEKEHILAYVNSFEKNMEYAWRAADLTISRAGGATLAEIIEFMLPAILIPYPLGSENHQEKNALYIADEIRGGVILREEGLHPSMLAEIVIDLLFKEKLHPMKKALSSFKEDGYKQQLCSLVLENI